MPKGSVPGVTECETSRAMEPKRTGMRLRDSGEQTLQPRGRNGRCGSSNEERSAGMGRR